MKRRLLHAERGAALLTAMIIVTLVSTLAASMVWQQWRTVQVETAERARAQAAWILSGALDWARLIVREDARTSANVDHLAEPWAVPLAEARLSTFLAADRAETDDAPEAFLSGWIVDAQSRFNLRNLINDRGELEPADVQALQRLCQIAGVAEGVATRIADGLRRAVAPELGKPAAEDAPLMPRRIAQLAWFGVEEDALSRLEPHVTLLPVRTTLNLNTASREVIAAVTGVDLGSAERLVQARQNAAFQSALDAALHLPNMQGRDLARRAGASTSYFEVHGRLRLGDQVLEQRSLLWRRDRNVVVSLQREQHSLRTAP